MYTFDIKMYDVLQIFINNEWRKSISGKTFDTYNPANGQRITSVQEGDAVSAVLLNN
jgi:acyl-CoA reductase-like NAD-dependent aldehyde dehydrogenase